MSERIGVEEREWARASEREGGVQHCRHSPTVTAPQPEDRGSSGSRGSGYDGGGRLYHPSAAQSPSLTASLWDHPAKLGTKLHSCPSQHQVLDPQLLQEHCAQDHHYFSRSCTPAHLLTHLLSNWSTLHSAYWTSEFFCCFSSSLPSELSGFTFILWRTMGLGWRGTGGAIQKRTEESWYHLVALLLLCGFWEAHTQTDDGKSVYFWETGTAKPLIRD